MIRPQKRIKILAFFALLLIIDWFLYFRHAAHFFQGDTIFLLNHRAASVSDYYWKELTALNPSGWYRPLANELIESILYPIAGLHPIPYRIPVYAVFLAITIAVYALALALTRRHLAAALAAFFFTIHTTNAYTTYDLGFMPELLFAFFYLGATLAYLRYLERGHKAAYWLSLACFVASLLSKEAAVTLPATLFLASLIFGSTSRSFSERFIRALRWTAPHVLILMVYLAFAVGHLHVMNLSMSKLFDQSQAPNAGDYIPVLNGGVFKNADLSLTWAFNIPRGWWGTWHQLKPGMLSYLKCFRAIVLVLMAVVVIRSERKAVLFGSAWFWITLLPALPLVSHFIPYYLFLPVVGLSLVVGVAFVWLYDLLRRFQPLLAGAVIFLVFGGILFATSRSIRGNIRDNPLLGASSRLASNTLNDLKRFYPTLPSEATLYFADAKENVVWEHDFGGLIKMAYGTDKISTLYQSQGDSLFPDTPNLLFFGVHNGRLIDQTALHRSNPTIFMKFAESDLELDLSVTEVTAGDKYMLTIRPLREMPVWIAYSFNDGVLEFFAARLDADGKATFNVSPQTKRGVYKFWAFKGASNEWVRAERTLTVR